MKKSLFFVPACLLITQAQATVLPLASVSVFDGEVSRLLQGEITKGEKNGETIFTLLDPVVIGGTDNGFEITSLTVDFNQDPFIDYGLVVKDFGAPSIFAFSFATPIVPTANPASVSASYSAAFTDSDGAFKVDPVGLDGDGDGIDEIQSFSVFDGSLKNAGVDLGAAYVGGAGSGNPPNEAAGPIAAPLGGAFTGLELDVDFQLTGGGDIYSATGRGEINATPRVPEPGSTLSLLGMAGIGLGVCSRLRRK